MRMTKKLNHYIIYYIIFINVIEELIDWKNQEIYLIQ